MSARGADRDGWVGEKGLHIPPGAYGEGQEHPHHLTLPWVAWGTGCAQGGQGVALAPALFHRHGGCELSVAGARHE